MLASSVAPAAEPQVSLRARQHRRTEVDLLWIAKQLGLTHHKSRTIVAKVRLLAQHSGFPLPKTPRFVGAERKTGADAIEVRSIWDRDPVELWLENDRPPAETAAVVQLRQSTTAAEMARRTADLVLVVA